ncbi:EGF-like and EMI domain-containing protein 1 [Diadema antillarum]|uniref:EGF-like and EMI domain-containing protein 1 n=1 Tax=Diadema antillarum TaxID=105358 RepID=UPI003A8A1AC0
MQGILTRITVVVIAVVFGFTDAQQMGVQFAPNEVLDNNFNNNNLIPTSPSSDNTLTAGMPNVCPYQELSMAGHRRPCVRPYTRMVKVWRPNCGYTNQWCVGYERRTAYYTSYRMVYERTYETKYKCCHGWSRLNGESGCQYRKYHPAR